MYPTLTEEEFRRARRWIERFRVHHTVVVEGFRGVREALATVDSVPRLVVITPEWLHRPEWHTLARHLRGRRACNVRICTPAQMRQLSTVETPPGLLAIFRQRPQRTWPPAAEGFYLYFYRIRDPGNLGTIFRTALATGVRGIFLSPKSVSPYNPKVTRASMSACLRIPFWIEVPPAHLIRWYQQTGMPLMIIHPRQSTPVWEFAWPRRGVMIFGGETASLPRPFRLLPGAHIPMLAEMDSLNVAVAVAVTNYLRLYAEMHRGGVLHVSGE